MFALRKDIFKIESNKWTQRKSLPKKSAGFLLLKIIGLAEQLDFL